MEQPTHIVIGISGKLYSGKDTVAAMINEVCKYVLNIRAFAYNVKAVTAILTGTTIEQNLSREGKSLVVNGTR